MGFKGGIRFVKVVVVAMAALGVAGCAGTSVVPPDLQGKIERHVSFQQINASPLSHRGKLVVVGGTVLAVKPLKQGGTRIEVLQLPLASDDEPHGPLTDSNGRFLALYKEFLDPATIPTGTRVTVVGEVTGSTSLSTPIRRWTSYHSPFGHPVCLLTYWFRPYPHFGVYWGPYGGPGRR